MCAVRFRASWLLQRERPGRRRALQLRRQQVRLRVLQRRRQPGRRQARPRVQLQQREPVRVQLPGLLLSCHRRPG